MNKFIPFAKIGAVALLLTGGLATSTKAEPAEPSQPTPPPQPPAVTSVVRKVVAPRAEVRIETIEDADADPLSGKDAAWLGVAVSEAPEALGAQLGLQAGAGLSVTYVSPDSPAAKAGLQKHDVLVQLDHQTLVLPAQLRKLVRVHKPDDSVKLVYYRAAKQETVSVKLAKAESSALIVGAGNAHEVYQQLRDLKLDEGMREQMKTLQDSLGNLKFDQHKIQVEVRRSVDEARKAVREALRHATNVGESLGPARQALEELARSGVMVDKDTRVTVRSAGKNVKSIVEAGDTGTIVLVSNPKLHLTAHDQEGKLVFDGEIETAEQRDKVPKDLWTRVEPLIEKMNAATPEAPESKDAE